MGQKESLKTVYAKVLDALKDDVSSSRDITASGPLEKYIEGCRRESETLLIRNSCKLSKIK